jgi:hypothetical protein
MAAEVELDVIIEALEMADDSISCYLDVETGEVHSITEEEFDLAEDPQTAIEDLPNWQREAVTLAQSIQKQEGDFEQKGRRAFRTDGLGNRCGFTVSSAFVGKGLRF